MQLFKWGIKGLVLEIFRYEVPLFFPTEILVAKLFPLYLGSIFYHISVNRSVHQN